ncbi:MAG: lytic transglycosylase domain-containing protein [Rhodospirillales bacterium]|nr:lytic transglycosylase domain-containing protein [Rhodospirillales bacterium]
MRIDPKTPDRTHGRKPQQWISVVFATLALPLAAFLLFAVPAAANPEVAALARPPASAEAAIDLPSVLSDSDIARYQTIFDLQEDGLWKKADREIAKLDDRILMGHFLAQRYLHPTHYRSKYAELKDWLDKYADHPDAQRLYKLALKRRPANWKFPKRPTGGFLYGSGHDGDLFLTPDYVSQKKMSSAQRRQVRNEQRKIRRFLRKGLTLAAKRTLKSPDVIRLMDPVDYDRERARLGAGYYAAGRDEWALDWAGKAAKRSGRYLPEAHWTAGLASWRLGRFEDAGAHFKAVAESRYSSPWLISAGGFWAARSYLKAHKPQNVNVWLGRAAAYPRTFYGMIAKKVLGLPSTFDWELPPMQDGAIDGLSDLPGAKRALALLQIGLETHAERELRNLYGSTSPERHQTILALATRANMAGLSMRLGNLLARQENIRFDSTTYPLPHWLPEDGFSVDRALIFAIMRQESGFNPKAKSHAGASGLMQLMPRTAGFIAQDRRFHRGSKRKTLFDPEVNLHLGQKYLSHLIAEPMINGDMFKLIASWNGGPGNVNKWLREVKHGNDPLLFIESIPARETRIFVERVLSNLWAYRHRFGQSTPSLDAIAAGDWPVYTPLDQRPLRIAENVQDRR